MSGRQLKVDLVANTSQFKSAMSETSANMRNIKSEMRATATETDKYGNSVQQNDARLKQLNGVMSQHRTRIQAIKNEQKHVTDEYKKGNITLKQHDDAQRNLSTRLNNTTTEMNRTEAQMKKLNSETKKNTRSFKDFDKKFRDIGSTMRDTGLKVGIAAGVGFVAMKRVLGDVIGEAKDFHAQMSEVKAISGATGDEMKNLTGQAKDLGKETVYTSQQVAEAQSNLARSGFNVNEIMETMPGLLDLAASSNMDLGRASDITSNIIRGFTMEAKDAGKVADILAKGAATANTDVEGLGKAMEVVAPVAHSLGVEFGDVAAATGIMADSGIDAGKAGRMLRQGMLRLSKPTGEAADLIDELGINVFDADGNMKSMDKVVGQLEKGLKGQTKQQKAAALSTLFGSESTAGWSTLLSSGSDVLKDYIADLNDSEGAAANMAETMQDNAEGAIVRMQSALSGLKIELGEKLLPVLAQGADFVGDLANKLSEMDEETIETIAKTALLVTAVLGVTTVVAGLVAGIGAFMMFAGPVGLAIAGGTLLLGGLAAALYNSSQKTKKLAEDQEKAAAEATRYGDGLSEGTRKGVKGYIDLYEGAKLEMYKLKTMSGEEAEQTKANVVKAFKDMGDMVVSELQDFATGFDKVVKEIYGIYEDEGKKRSKEINKQVQEDVKEMVTNYEKASQRLAEITEEYGGVIDDYPPKVRETYDKNLAIMADGAKAFAVTYDDALAVRNRIAENKDKILAGEAEKWLKEIESTHREAQGNINQNYVEQAEIIEKHKILYPEQAEIYEEMMETLSASTSSEYAKVDKVRAESVEILRENTDTSGKLLDYQSGKELERIDVFEHHTDKYGAGMTKRAETDEEYYLRYIQSSDDYINALSTNSKTSLDHIEKSAYDWKISMGATEKEAIKFAKDIKDGTLKEFDKDSDKAKKSGENKGKAHISGMVSTTTANDIAANNLSRNVSHKLGSSTDGGGGRKAGSAFGRGILGQRGFVSRNSQTVAKSGRSGLNSVSTSGAGTNFVAGFRGSINSGSGSVWNAAWSIGKSALGALNRAIRTGSPSKETAKTGGWFTEGFQLGIAEEERNAVKQATQLAGNTHGAMQDELAKLSHNFSAAAFSLQANKDVFKVEHEINNSGLESKINSLENTVSKLTDTLITLTKTQHQQMVQVAQREMVIEMDADRVGKAVQSSVNKKTDVETAMKLQMLGIQGG